MGAAAILVKRVHSPSSVPADCFYDNMDSILLSFQEKLEVGVFRKTFFFFSVRHEFSF